MTDIPEDARRPLKGASQASGFGMFWNTQVMRFSVVVPEANPGVRTYSDLRNGTEGLKH